MRFDGWKLGYIEVWWFGGYYSPNHQNDCWWRPLSYGAPDSPVCHRTLFGAPAMSPGRWVPTVGASDNGPTGQSLFIVRCAIWRLLWLLRARLHCSLFTVALLTTVGAWSHCSAWHTGQSGDSPVKYSGAASPNSRRWQIWSWAPWCTEHCPVHHRTVRCARPGQPSVPLLLFTWTLSWTFYWFIVNLWHL
jgi:hypothetical protein